MEQIEELLKLTLHQSDWVIAKPSSGRSKESYIAEKSGKKVFVKLDVFSHALDTLSEIGVAPKVLASGDQNGVPFVVQEFIEGTNPDENWFRSHIREVARLIKNYHSNKKLKEELSRTQTTDYRTHLDKELSFLEKYLGMVNLEILNKEDIYEKIQLLKNQADFLEETELVPTHSDPNPANFMITPEKFYMIDWDILFFQMK